MTGGSKPSNHIPTNAPCAQCHTTANNYALYSVTGTHQGVTDCLSCHAPSVANTFANVTIVSTSGINHIPIGNLDCNGSGCHTTAKLTAGGFKLGAANIHTPTLSTAGHITVSAQIGACQTCHQAAPYLGMIPSTSSTAGDSRPNATLDSLHPAAGDCGDCHTQTPIFSSDLSTGAKPANHIPTTATCSQCHTTAGNFALYSVTGTHQGVSNCLSCHGPPPAGGWANITIVGTASTNHMPIGNLDCNGSGCHTTAKVTAGGFKLGAASISAPTLNVAGHTTVAGKVPACTTCHESAPYVGMIASTSSTAGDSRPNATLDKSHPTHGRLQRLPHHEPDLYDRPDRQRQARQPHSHQRPVRAVSYDRGQQRALLGHRHPPGREQLPELPWTPAGRRLGEHHDRGHGQHQSHADREPRLQRLGLPHDREGHRRWLQARGREHQRPDPECGRPHDGGGEGARLHDLPRERALMWG